jgi:membrane protease YdiL (CAAX protease family)
VAISSAGYAASHLSVQGFPQLLALGVLLGTLHVGSGRNLLLPTFTHSLFNTIILCAVLISLPPGAMEPIMPLTVMP